MRKPIATLLLLLLFPTWTSAASTRYFEKNWSGWGLWTPTVEKKGPPRPPEKKRGKGEGKKERKAKGKKKEPRPVPEVVRVLVENPTVENARRYLRWQKRRAEKIRAAMEAVRKAVEEEEKRKEKGKGTRPPAIFAFLSLHCPYCRKQAAVLSLMARGGKLPRETVVFLSGATPAQAGAFAARHRLPFPVLPDQGEAAAAGVTTFPTILVLRGKKAAKLKGLATEKDVLKAVELTKGTPLHPPR